jgi:HEPN domain-containing protein
MPPEDARTYLTRQWLVKADHDLATADRMAGAAPLPDIVAFHCQQAAEKALKAYLAWHNQPFRRTHDLEELVDQCVGVSPVFAVLRPVVAARSPYAWTTRYPGHDPGPTPEAAGEARRQAGEVVTFVHWSQVKELGRVAGCRATWSWRSAPTP